MARGLTAGRAPFSLPGSGLGSGFYLDGRPIGNPVPHGRFVCFHSSARFVQPVLADDTVAGGQLPDFKGVVSHDVAASGTLARMSVKTKRRKRMNNITRFPTGLKMGDD
jgi:hypothetical protein